ncbi:DNA-processing protein DprA [Neokomagataea anthophila]|uniref:DNA-processing protein DprA n=1 Tax=Neokomagataea anthophila TaxID=2826925 RepID=A0ABS5E3M6_9PROT|nr:DNA-processing protein DprA [Neokomagataea anthophila]MBR0558505.1 DNA-processing protein DprA [Neokomagataea anthophila]
MSLHPTTPLTERINAIRLSRVSGVGPANFTKLMRQYGSATQVLDNLPERFLRAGRATTPAIPSRTTIEAELAWLDQNHGRALLRSDPEYPRLLSHITDAPPVLFTRGDVRKLSQPAIGIVGARNASAAGIRMAESLSAEMAAHNLCVISGLARGIDSAAHQAALHPGLTVAAIASGLDHIYPPEHTHLQHAIAERGCLITEAPLGTIPQARHFPRRNRLIAGLGLGCVVVEAALHSGTLITARLAQDYERPLFAVPGSPLDPRSRGGNMLLRHGAILTENIHDILPELSLQMPAYLPAPWCFNRQNTLGFSESSIPWEGPKIQPNTPQEDLDFIIEHIHPLLSVTSVTVDEVVSRCQFSVSAVLSALTELELGGVLEFVPGGRVALLPT